MESKPPGYFLKRLYIYVRAEKDREEESLSRAVSNLRVRTPLYSGVCIQLVNGMEMASEGIWPRRAVPCMSCIIKRRDPADLDPPSFFGR